MSQQKNEQEQSNLIDVSVEKTKKALQNFTSTYEELSKIKASLDVLIDTFTDNPSFLSSASIYWGELVLWQKILAGLLLAAPLVVGAVLNIGILIAISAVTLGFFILIAISLENHHELNNSNTQRIKDGVSSLANLLSTVINALAHLGDELKESIEKMHVENTRLTKNVDALAGQINLLTNNLTKLKDIEKRINNEKMTLEHIIRTLKSSVDENATLFNSKHQELMTTIQAHQAQQVLLSEKIEELDTIKTKMAKNIEKNQQVTLVLQTALEQLSENLFADKDIRLSYIEKLKLFVANQESSFLAIVERICNAESELVEVKEELKRSNERYGALLTIQEKLISRLEKMAGVSSLDELDQKSNASGNRHGFYSPVQPQSITPMFDGGEVRLEVTCS